MPEADASGQGHGGVGSVLPADALWTFMTPAVEGQRAEYQKRLRKAGKALEDELGL